MEGKYKKIIIDRLWQLADVIVTLILGICTILIAELHFLVSFFPILFLFDFYCLIGYNLFIKYVLKLDWDECVKKHDTKLKYVLLPFIILEIIVMFIYWPEICFLLDHERTSQGWKEI